MITFVVGMYLKLGWQPYLYQDDMEGRWRSVYERQGLPPARDECVFP